MIRWAKGPLFRIERGLLETIQHRRPDFGEGWLFRSSQKALTNSEKQCPGPKLEKVVASHGVVVAATSHTVARSPSSSVVGGVMSAPPYTGRKSERQQELRIADMVQRREMKPATGRCWHAFVDIPDKLTWLSGQDTMAKLLGSSDGGVTIKREQTGPIMVGEEAQRE